VRCQLLTLLFLEAVGLRRTLDLRSYTGQALALLTGRRLAYGYRYTERFLAELAQVEAHEQPCLPDGRRLLFRVQGAEILRLDAQEQAVA
jgi:hypothetical protein